MYDALVRSAGLSDTIDPPFQICNEGIYSSSLLVSTYHGYTQMGGVNILQKG